MFLDGQSAGLGSLQKTPFFLFLQKFDQREDAHRRQEKGGRQGVHKGVDDDLPPLVLEELEVGFFCEALWHRLPAAIARGIPEGC
jgi:hypothetical protein